MSAIFGVVSNISLKIKRKSIQLTLHAQNDAEYELWEVKRKGDLLEKLTGKALHWSLAQARGNGRTRAAS